MRREELAITPQSGYEMFINDNDVGADCGGGSEALGEPADAVALSESGGGGSGGGSSGDRGVGGGGRREGAHVRGRRQSRRQ